MLGMSTQHSLHAALETSDRRFRRLVETATEGIWIVDADARINFANARMAEMLGCSVPDLIGRSVFEFVPAERVGTELKLSREGHWSVGGRTELVLRRVDDGKDVPVLISSSPLTNDEGELLGVLGMVTDISALKQSERLLRAHEEELTAFQFQTEIPLNIEVEYAHQNEQSVLAFAPKSLGALAYQKLTEEVLQL